MTTLLSIQNLTKRFGDVCAVDDITLDVSEGEFLTFLGPSGSGKSTLLYMIAGLEIASEGDIRIDQSSLLTVPPHKRNIGMVFQRYTLIPHLSVRENVAFPLRVRHWSDTKVEQRVNEMLSLVQLDGLAHRRPSQLSGGQQQRVAVARALSYSPRILLMDEPLAALDKKLKDELQVEVKRIHRETGVTIVYVTHDQEEALRLSDRIAVFNTGRIEQISAPTELYEHPASRFVAGFVGNSNFLPVKFPAGLAVCPDGTDVDGARRHASFKAGEAGSMLVRPEKISIAAQATAEMINLRVTLSDVSYLGEVLDLTLKTQWGQMLSARTSASIQKDAPLTLGSEVYARWEPKDGLIFNQTPAVETASLD